MDIDTFNACSDGVALDCIVNKLLGDYMSNIKVGDKGWSSDITPATVTRVGKTGSHETTIWYSYTSLDGDDETAWCTPEVWLGRLQRKPIATGVVPEYTGGSVDYYKVSISKPTSAAEPYMAECNDIIEALGMNYAEGNAFKALWRRAAHRTLGKKKAGAKDDGLYDAEKVAFFGQRLVEQSKVTK